MNKRKMDENAIDQIRNTKQNKILHDKPIPERGTVVFDFMVSLQNIVMAKIVNSLWIIHSINNSNWSGTFFKWDKVENNIVVEISKFSLPHLISSKLTYLVPAAAKSIRQWITHFHAVLLHASKFSDYGSISVDLIRNITWTASGKIDYAQTARNILDDKDICLSEDTKFKIACTYCLEDEIALLAPNVVNKYFLDNIDSFMRPMVYFWCTHITGHNIEETLRGKIENMLYSQCDFVTRDLGINEVIFQILIENVYWTKRTFNEVAITCVWNELTAEEKAKNITTLIKKMDDQSLKYTLLSNLKYEQQQDIFKECSYSILVGILKAWSWEEYFLPTALHFLDVMKPLNFLNIIIKVTERINKNSQKENHFTYNQYKSIFKELWQKWSRNLKDFLFEHKDGSFLMYFLILLPCKQNMDILGLILNDLNTQQRKNVISGLYGIRICFVLIRNDMYELLELFITHSFFSENDITQFKQAFVKEKGLQLAELFLMENASYKIENFMTWAFNSQEETDQFRKSLSHAVICHATLDLIITHNKADFTELENHFNWCAKGVLKVIRECKAEIPKSFQFELLMERLIENDSYDLLEKVLNWCFSDDEQKIVQFKSHLCKDNDFTIFFNSVTINLIKKDDSFTMLERFLQFWCFTDEQEIKEFKTRLLNPPLGDFFSVCTELLRGRYLDLADKFINWCITSPEEVCIYKNTLMLCERDMKQVFNFAGDDTQADMELLIKWFNPFKVTLQKFRSLILKGKIYISIAYRNQCLREINKSLSILKDNEESAL